MFKLIPRHRPYVPPVPLKKVHFTVPRKYRDEELNKKKNKKGAFKKLIGLRRMGASGTNQMVRASADI
jgi:hypothetical protein